MAGVDEPEAGGAGYEGVCCNCCCCSGAFSGVAGGEKGWYDKAGEYAEEEDGVEENVEGDITGVGIGAANCC